jgi:hypothetical protein
MERRHSSFNIRLYGKTWVNLTEVNQDLVTD